MSGPWWPFDKYKKIHVWAMVAIWPKLRDGDATEIRDSFGSFLYSRGQTVYDCTRDDDDDDDDNNNNGYLERLTRTGPKRLHLL